MAGIIDVLRPGQSVTIRRHWCSRLGHERLTRHGRAYVTWSFGIPYSLIFIRLAIILIIYQVLVEFVSKVISTMRRQISDKTRKTRISFELDNYMHYEMERKRNIYFRVGREVDCCNTNDPGHNDYEKDLKPSSTSKDTLDDKTQPEIQTMKLSTFIEIQSYRHHKLAEESDIWPDKYEFFSCEVIPMEIKRSTPCYFLMGYQRQRININIANCGKSGFGYIFINEAKSSSDWNSGNFGSVFAERSSEECQRLPQNTDTKHYNYNDLTKQENDNVLSYSHIPQSISLSSKNLNHTHERHQSFNLESLNSNYLNEEDINYKVIDPSIDYSHSLGPLCSENDAITVKSSSEVGVLYEDISPLTSEHDTVEHCSEESHETHQSFNLESLNSNSNEEDIMYGIIDSSNDCSYSSAPFNLENNDGITEKSCSEVGAVYEDISPLTSEHESLNSNYLNEEDINYKVIDPSIDYSHSLGPLCSENDAITVKSSSEVGVLYEDISPLTSEHDTVEQCSEESHETHQSFNLESLNSNSNEEDIMYGIIDSSNDCSYSSAPFNLENNDGITEKSCSEVGAVYEDISPLTSEHDTVEHCSVESSSNDFDLLLSTEYKKEKFDARNTEPNKFRKIWNTSIKTTINVVKKYKLIRNIVNEMIPILKTPETFGLKFVKENLAPLRLYGSHMSKPVETQVNFLEARPHPHTVNGIPWKKLNYESFRLMSFVKFPRSSPLSTIKLASKGFAYLDLASNGAILCFFCSAQIEVSNNEDHIDEEHRRLGVNCPMVKDARCSNISMESQRPKMTADEILSQLNEYRNNESEVNQPSTSASAAISKNQNPDKKPDNVKSSQPSDESASCVIVTNTSDLAEGDGPLQNGGQPIQSSQIMDDSASPLDQQDLSVIASSLISESADNNNTVQNSSEAEGTAGQESDTQQEKPNEGQNSTDDNGGEANSYEKLGIITARPKRLEYAVYAARFNSFAEWPKDHYMKPNDLAKAGYFYTGYSDCARCFFCGGGLRNWEPQDNVWVEHARWFPKCAFLFQEVGKDFIETVQEMSKERDEISYDDVIQRMKSSDGPTPLKFNERVIERDPAVLSVIDNGFDKDTVVRLALEIRKLGEILSSDKLYEIARRRGIPKADIGNNLGSDSVSIRKGGNEKRDKETIDTLRSENTELRQQTTCKICMDNEVSVVFLPCGHLVSCTECSSALSMCPLCRVGIKGIVRAYIG